MAFPAGEVEGDSGNLRSEHENAVSKLIRRLLHQVQPDHAMNQEASNKQFVNFVNNVP